MFTTILTIHHNLAYSALYFMIIIGLWNMVNYIRGRGLDGNIMGALAIGEMLMIFQAIMGLTMFAYYGISPGRTIHFLYGTLSTLIFPSVWFHTEGDTSRRASLVWALTGLAMMGLSLRAMGTADWLLG